MLFRTPGVTLIAVLSLALGIVGNSTIFSVIYALLLKPPLYTDPEDIALIFGANITRGRDRDMVTYADALDWQKQSRSFRDIAVCGVGAAEATLVAGETPERIRWQYVSPNLFQLLGVKPLLGRDLNDPAFYRRSQGILLSYEFWQRRFGGDPSVVSLSVNLNGRPVTVAGVMPRGFQAFSNGRGTDIWQALDWENGDQLARAIPWLLGVGRLAPGSTLAKAETELVGIAKQLEQEYPDTNKNRTVIIEPLQVWMSGTWNALIPLAGAVAFVLLMACANVANLLLARAGERQKELVVRSALGAGRWRLIRQLLTKSVLLSAMGGICGLALAWFAIPLFKLLSPAWFPHYAEITLNGPVLLFTLTVSIVVGILAGLAPAIQASRTNLNEALKEGARASLTRGRKRTRAALVAFEVALAVVLVTGAGLMINTLTRLLRVNPGYDPAKLITMQIYLSGISYMEIIKQRENSVRLINPRVQVVYDRVLDRVRGLPGVESASLVGWVPQAGNNVGPHLRRIQLQGQPAPRSGEEPSALYNAVEADYFLTMRIPLLRGRLLSHTDTQAGEWVVVINEAAAKHSGQMKKHWDN